MKIYQDILHYVKNGDGQYSILMRTHASPYTQLEICMAYDTLISDGSLCFNGEKLILTKRGEAFFSSLQSHQLLGDEENIETLLASLC